MGSILRNRKYFDVCINTANSLLKEGHLDECANFINKLSFFAWGNCTGYYASWRLESFLNKIGEKVQDQGLESIKTRSETRRKVLHVASSLYETGGHTRLLFNWIKNDVNSSHSVVLTRQQKSEFPNELITEFDLDASIFSQLRADGTVCEKSKELRALSLEYDFVILHIHPDDVIPIIAFSHKEKKPPVFFVNHADHVYWLGVSVSDYVLQIRESVLLMDIQRRGINSQFLLPIIIEDASQISENYCLKARESLDIPCDCIMLLTTGSEYKFRPNEKYNFYESIGKIVKENSKVIVYLVGIEPTSELALKFSHPQIVYKGLANRTELSLYEAACDIYLEGFPLSSFTALLQPALKGKVVHLMYDPAMLTMLFNSNTENGFFYSTNALNWHESLNKLINDTVYRKQLQNKQYAYVQRVYSKESWQNKLDEIYNTAQLKSHEIKKQLKDTAFLTNDELLLSSVDLKFSINHFQYCYSLSIWNKVLHLFRLRHKIKTVNTGRIKGLAAFFLKKR